MFKYLDITTNQTCSKDSITISLKFKGFDEMHLSLGHWTLISTGVGAYELQTWNTQILNV